MNKLKKRITGFLTNDDLELLERASTRELKHKKQFVDKWTCESCDYSWFYNAMRCPSCSSQKIVKAEE